jgi:hypothetical protein
VYSQAIGAVDLVFAASAIAPAKGPRLMLDDTTPGSRPASNILLPLMAVASFLLYALGVLTLHQDRAHGWALEAAGAVPVAVSYLVYGTPLGATDHNVLQSFLQPDGKSVQDVLATAATGSIPHGAVDMYSMDGSGSGADLFATAAMGLFGISMASLVRFYLVLIGLSVVAFVLRYQDKRLFVLPLYFFVLTVMLLTPLGTSAAAATQMPIGGQRYFVLAPILPALHIFFELIDRSDTPEAERRIANRLLLLVQAVLLFGALVVRNSTGYLLGALLCVLVWRLCRERKRRIELIALLRNAAILVAAFAFCAVILAAALPAYLKTGRLFGNFWHRAFATLSVDPDWPYGDLRTVYDCTKFIPEGLTNQNDDRNGHCIWWIYPPNATRSAADIMSGTYGREYETAARNAYFYVLFHYPKQMFRLYVYMKSRLIVDVLRQDLDYLLAIGRTRAAGNLVAIAAAQLLLFISFVVSVAAAGLAIVDRPLIIFPAFFIFSLAPLYVAAANSWKTADTTFLMYACLVLAVLLVLQLMTKILAPQ